MSTTAIPSRTIAGVARPGRLRRPSFRLLLLLPAIIYLALMTQAPFVLTLWYSVHKWILTEPDLGQGFVGLSNFTYTILQDTIFRDAVINTLIITIGIVGFSLLLGLAFALLLHRKFPLRGLVRSLMIAPFFVMPTVNAVVWKNLLLNPVFGFINWLQTTLGFPRVDWLAQYPKEGIIA